MEKERFGGWKSGNLLKTVHEGGWRWTERKTLTRRSSSVVCIRHDRLGLRRAARAWGTSLGKLDRLSVAILSLSFFVCVRERDEKKGKSLCV